MNDQSGKDEVVFRGRLSWLTFIKVCFLGVVGSLLIVVAVLLLIALIHAAAAPDSGRPASMGDAMWNFRGLMVLYAVVQTFVWALLTGVLGYPLPLQMVESIERRACPQSVLVDNRRSACCKELHAGASSLPQDCPPRHRLQSCGGRCIPDPTSSGLQINHDDTPLGART